MGMGVGPSYLGRLYARRGDFETARAMLDEALGRFEAMGASHFVLETKTFQTRVRGARRNVDEVLDSVESHSIQAARDIEDPLLETILQRTEAQGPPRSSATTWPLRNSLSSVSNSAERSTRCTR